MDKRIRELALLVGLIGACFATARADETIPAKPAVDPMIGNEAGQVRDDNGLGMKLVWCPPGFFVMGSPKPESDRKDNEDQVRVTLTTGFWLGKYEVARAEWKQLMENEPWIDSRNAKVEGDDFPVSNVNWNDAMEFCRKFTEGERNAGRIPEGWEYTLPTEAQWERAGRAGTETTFSFGDDESKLLEYEWVAKNAMGAGEPYPHRVGQKNPNGWGLHDMHGNVVEWCRDDYSEKLVGGRDPEVIKGRKSRPGRVIRGGSYLDAAKRSRSAHRGNGSPSSKSIITGFRVALVPVRPKQPSPESPLPRLLGSDAIVPIPVMAQLPNLLDTSSAKSVHQELGISEEVATELRLLASSYRNLSRSAAVLTSEEQEIIEKLSEDERKLRIRDLQSKNRQAEMERLLARVKELLAPQDFERVHQIQRQVRGSVALTEPDLVDALKLTKEQQEQIARVNQAYDEKGSDMQRTKEPVAVRIRKSYEIRRERDDQALSVLTEQQREEYSALLGKPFDIEKFPPLSFSGRRMR